jgi:hypothetical protein
MNEKEPGSPPPSGNEFTLFPPGSNGQTTRRQRIIVGAVIFLAVVGIGLLLVPAFLPYRASQYRGDGTITDKGAKLHFRYTVRFPVVPLNTPGQYTFNCAGLPPEPMNFRFYMAKNASCDSVKALGTVVNLTVLDPFGKPVVSSVGRMKDWTQDFFGFTSSCYFSQPQLRDLEFSSGQDYRVELVIKDVDPQTPAVELQPVLESSK